MEFLKDLLNATLLPMAVAIAILLQVLKNLWSNAITGEFPKWGDVVLAAVAFLASLFFVSTWQKYLPLDAPPSLLTDLWMQTAILWLGTVFSHFILKQTYGSGRPPATADELRGQLSKVDPVVAAKAGVTVSDMKPSTIGDGLNVPVLLGFVLGLVLVFGLLGVAHAQPNRTVYRDGVAVTEPDSSLLAVWRLSGYVDAKAMALQGADGMPLTAFVPGAGLSYAPTSEGSVVAGLEVDPASGAAWGNVGARLLTYASSGPHPLLLFVGVDAVWPNDHARELLGWTRARHTELSIRAGAPIARKENGSALFAATVAVRWSPDERVVVDGLELRRKPHYSVGLRWQAFGGVPNTTTTADR